VYVLTCVVESMFTSIGNPNPWLPILAIALPVGSTILVLLDGVRKVRQRRAHKA
jgi:hypothetical protein